jgi:hypothetical protein
LHFDKLILASNCGTNLDENMVLSAASRRACQAAGRQKCSKKLFYV